MTALDHPSTNPARERASAQRWAAYLLSGWWESNAVPPAGDAPDAAEVLAVLRKNGVPLLTFGHDPRPTARALLATGSFVAALEADRAKMAGQQSAFAEIRAAWQAARIPALFVKAFGPLPTFPYVSNNLDVLVPQAQEDAARAIVRRLGYVELRHIEEPHKFLFRRYHLGESVFDLHIHGRLEWHTEFVNSAAVFSRAVYAPDCDLALVPAPADALLIALAHAIYENKALKLIELGKLIYAARIARVDWDAAARGAAARGWEDGFWTALALCRRWEEDLYGSTSLPAPIAARAEQGAPAFLRSRLDAIAAPAAAKAPLRLRFVDSKRLFYAKMLADPSHTLFSRARDVYTHTLYGTRVRLRLRSQRPLLIALDGIDGCGKGAHAELFQRALDGAALRHRIVWTRGGGSALLQPLRHLGKRLLAGNGREKEETSRDVKEVEASAGFSHDLGVAPGRETARAHLFRHPLARALWPWLITGELAASYLWRIGLPLLRGEVVIADRYLLSALTELGARTHRPAIAQTLPARLLRLLAPRPHRTYWLDIPPYVALARKAGRESAAFLAAQAAIAPAVASALRADRLDACEPLADLSDAIVTDTLRAYEDSHRTLLNALFCANPRPLKGGKP